MQEKNNIMENELGNADVLEIAECMLKAKQEGRLRPHPMAVLKNKLVFLQEGLTPEEADQKAREKAMAEQKFHGTRLLTERIACYVKKYEETKAATEQAKKLAQA